MDLTDDSEVFEVIDAFLCFFVLADDGAAFKGIEDFGGVETEDGKVAVVENTAVLVVDSEGMSGVINDLEIIFIRDSLNCIHIAGVSITVDWHDSRGLGGDCGLNL